MQDKQRMRPELSEVLKLVSDNTLAQQKMNWSPQVSLDAGLSADHRVRASQPVSVQERSLCEVT